MAKIICAQHTLSEAYSASDRIVLSDLCSVIASKLLVEGVSLD